MTRIKILFIRLSLLLPMYTTQINLTICSQGQSVVFLLIKDMLISNGKNRFKSKVSTVALWTKDIVTRH